VNCAFSVTIGGNFETNDPELGAASAHNAKMAIHGNEPARGSPAAQEEDITQTQLSKDTAIAKSTISEILAGKKPFSRQMIRKLADYFGVDASVLVANF
jgi:hypothetical protein